MDAELINFFSLKTNQAMGLRSTLCKIASHINEILTGTSHHEFHNVTNTKLRRQQINKYDTNNHGTCIILFTTFSILPKKLSP